MKGNNNSKYIYSEITNPNILGFILTSLSPSLSGFLKFNIYI